MNKSKTQTTPQEEADVEFAELVTQCFEDYMQYLNSRGTNITSAPEMQYLLNAYQKMLPGASRECYGAKMFLCFAAGVDYGVRIWSALESAGQEVHT